MFSLSKMGFPLGNVTIRSPYSFFMPGYNKDKTSNTDMGKTLSQLLEY